MGVSLSKACKILMYSPDSIGLGHVRRNSTIASEIARQAEDASIMLMVGSGAGAFFSLPMGVDSVKLPSVQKVASNEWRARSLNLTAPQTTSVRASMIQEITRTFEPDVLVVDHLPRGIWNELVPTLRMIDRSGRRTRVVLGLRDILDKPDEIRARWREDGVYDAIERYYDEVLIYGDRDVFATGELYGIDKLDNVEVTYSGYVFDGSRSNNSPASDDEVLPGLEDLDAGERVVVACGGGGHDAYPMLSQTIGAAGLVDADTPVRFVVIAGPLMPADDRARLNAQALACENVRLVPWTSDCLSYLNRSDVSVIMAGYNSSLEALSTSARIVMAPRAGPSSEQRIRANLMSRRGYVAEVAPEDASPERFAFEISRALKAPARADRDDLLNGASNAAKRIIELASTGAEGTASDEMTKEETSSFVLF